MTFREALHTFNFLSFYYYRVAHEKPARRLVEQRGRRSQTLYRKLNECKCKVNSPNWHRWVASRVWQYAAACTKVHWRTRRTFSAPSLTNKYFAFAFV